MQEPHHGESRKMTYKTLRHHDSAIRVRSNAGVDQATVRLLYNVSCCLRVMCSLPKDQTAYLLLLVLLFERILGASVGGPYGVTLPFRDPR